jgi:hypothetical protein
VKPVENLLREGCQPHNISFNLRQEQRSVKIVLRKKSIQRSRKIDLPFKTTKPTFLLCNDNSASSLIDTQADRPSVQVGRSLSRSKKGQLSHSLRNNFAGRQLKTEAEQHSSTIYRLRLKS